MVKQLLIISLVFNNPYCNSGKYCHLKDLELLALEWNEIEKDKWIDVVQNINFDDDPERIFNFTGNLIIDHKGRTNWSKMPGFNTCGFFELTHIDTEWIYSNREKDVKSDYSQVIK